MPKKRPFLFAGVIMSRFSSHPITQLQPVAAQTHATLGNLLRVGLTLAQVFGVLGVTTVSVTQPDVLAPLTGEIQTAQAATGDVTGVVFIDYNTNGRRNTNGTSPNYAIDAGVQGVTVTAYNAAGAVVAATTTDAAGLYTFTTGLTYSTPLRIEFTGWRAMGYESGPRGRDNGSSVQLVRIVTGTLSNVSFSVINPADCCQNNPKIAISSMVYNSYTSGNAADPGVAKFDYDASGSTGQGWIPTDMSIGAYGQVGSTFGIAYHRTARRVFASAYMKRLTDLGPGMSGSQRSGTIYMMSRDGYPYPGNDATPFVDLDHLFGAGTTGIISATRDFDPLDGNGDFDNYAYDKIGKVGLGDLEISEDDSTLFVTNLADRKLYQLPLGLTAQLTPTAPTAGQVYSTNIPSRGWVSGSGRLFGWKYRAGTL